MRWWYICYDITQFRQVMRFYPTLLIRLNCHDLLVISILRSRFMDVTQRGRIAWHPKKRLRFHCIYRATFFSIQSPADYEEEAALGTRIKGTLKLAINLKQVVIRERRLTQHHSMIVAIHSSGSCTVNIQWNELTTVLMEKKSGK